MTKANTKGKYVQRIVKINGRKIVIKSTIKTTNGNLMGFEVDIN